MFTVLTIFSIDDHREGKNIRMKYKKKRFVLEIFFQTFQQIVKQIH